MTGLVPDCLRVRGKGWECVPVTRGCGGEVDLVPSFSSGHLGARSSASVNIRFLLYEVGTSLPAV